MKGGNIDEISNLVFRDVPMINKPEKLGEKPERLAGVKPMYHTVILSGQQGYNTLESQDINITQAWTPYIEFKKIEPGNGYIYFQLSFKENIFLNIVNSRGQTLLYLAAQNCNKIMFDALVAMGVNPKTLNSDGSTILHGIAWGKTDASGKLTKTYDEKVKFIQYILQIYPDIILFLFHKNSRQETFYDNLLMRHPDKM